MYLILKNNNNNNAYAWINESLPNKLEIEFLQTGMVDNFVLHFVY